MGFEALLQVVLLHNGQLMVLVLVLVMALMLVVVLLLVDLAHRLFYNHNGYLSWPAPRRDDNKRNHHKAGSAREERAVEERARIEKHRILKQGILKEFSRNSQGLCQDAPSNPHCWLHKDRIVADLVVQYTPRMAQYTNVGALSQGNGRPTALLARPTALLAPDQRLFFTAAICNLLYQLQRLFWCTLDTC
jgi:hypothetical protein